MSRLERAGRLLDRTGLNRLLLRAPSWSGVLILNYHRIGCATGSCYDRSGWSTPEGLDEHLELILKHFDVISLDELEEVRSQGFLDQPGIPVGRDRVDGP